MVRRSIPVPAAALFLAWSASLPAAEVLTDATVRFQTIEGWGACMIGWSLSSTPYNDPAWRAAYRDLGCNILRIPMIKEVLVADRQNPDYRVPVPLGPDLQANINLMNFRIQPLTTWADVAVWLKNNALEPDRVKVSGSPWSPPHWMKGPTGVLQSHVTNPGVKHPTPWLSGTTQGDSIGGRLKTEDAGILRMYGRYLAAWVKGFEQTYGLPIYILSLQNESTFENPFDSMTFVINAAQAADHGQYAMGLKSVKDAWQEYGLTTQVMGPHVANIGPTPDSPWALLAQMRMIDGVKNHADPGLIGFLDFYNSNYYMGTSEAAVQATAGYFHGKDQVPANWVHWAYAPGVKQDGKPIWYSETGGAQANWLTGSGGTPGDGAITVAQKMHNALVWSDAAAYVYWQMSDTNQGETVHTLLGRSHVANPHDSKKYCAFKHFARYVRPGARRIQARFDNGKTSVGGGSEYDTYRGLNVSAFLHETDRTLAYVFVNMRPAAEPVNIRLPAGAAVSSFTVHRTSASESFARLADLPVAAGVASLTIPAYSVVTLVGTLNVPATSPDLDGDGDADQSDFGLLQICLTYDAAPPLDPDCAQRDLDGDGDTDPVDALAFLDCRSGSGIPFDPDCLDR